MKKFIGLFMTIVMLLAISNTAYAKTDTELSDKQKAEIIKSEILKDQNVRKFLSEKEKVKVPTVHDVKKMLQAFFKEHPTGNEQNIKKIDSIANECVIFIENLLEYDYGIQDWRWYVHMHQWVSGPTTTSTSYYRTLGDKHERDNRGSSIPVDCTFSSSMKATASVGFSGSAEIKDVISSSIDADGSFSYETTVSEKVTVPAYTYWSRQAYALMKTDNYTGTQAIYKYTYVSIPGTLEGIWTFVFDHSETVSGSNTNGYGGGIDYTSYK